MATSKLTLHRVLSAPPDKVFKAFTNPDAMAFWLPPYGFVCRVHTMDVRVGGTYRITFTNFSTGNSHSFGGEYVSIKPDAFLQYVEEFDDPSLPGKMTTTVELRSVMCGTELSVTQEGIPEAIPVEMCYLGWQESLEKLKQLVEPVIPD